MPPYHVPILAYHDIVSVASDEDEPDTVTLDNLIRHFAYLQANGYTPISLKRLDAAISGEQALPPNPIMLTFDDGYASFCTKVLPLLEAYHWPALLAIEGSWLDQQFAGLTPPDAVQYLNREQLAQVVQSGLVEFGSHTYNLHYGMQTNPLGSKLPAAINRKLDGVNEESTEAWTSRVTEDLLHNQQRIEDLTGQRPTAMVWPFGRYNKTISGIAASVGLTTQFTLDDGVSDIFKDSTQFKRYLVGHEEKDIDTALENPSPFRLVRAVSLRVSDLSASAASDGEPLLSAAINALYTLHGNTLVLDAFARKDGRIIGAEYPTEVVPTLSVYSNRVAATMAGKAGYDVWLSVPLSVDAYPTLSSNEILQLIEDAAIAMPLTGLLVEDADKVSPEFITAALERVSRWRSRPLLVLASTDTNSPGFIQKVSDTKTDFAWLIPTKENLLIRTKPKTPTIWAFSGDQLEWGPKALLLGQANFGLLTLPSNSDAWVESFSLVGFPRVRVEPLIR